MKNGFNISFLMLLTIAVTPSSANTTQPATSPMVEAQPELVTNVPAITTAFNAMIKTNSLSWSYVREEYKEDETRLERFDPSSDQPWQLLQVSGDKPDPTEIKDYNKKQSKLIKREHPVEFKAHKIAKLDSFNLLTEAGDLSTYTFELVPDEEDDMSEFLQGALVLNQKENQIISIKLTNPEPFSPAFSVKIKRMELKFNYQTITKNGPVFLTEINQSVDGKMMGFKKISEQSTIKYSNFKAPVLMVE